MPTARADVADNVNSSGNSNTERDFTPLWAHLKISAGPGVRKETICSFYLMGNLLFLFPFFSIPFFQSLFSLLFQFMNFKQALWKTFLMKDPD